MKFWLISHTDALPGELGFERSLQTARALVRSGHEVVWWNAGFSHAEKKVRATKLTAITYPPGFKVLLLPVRAYGANQSLGRLLSIFDFACQFTLQHGKESLPDAILVSGPILFSEPALLYLKWKHRVPVVFEFRDLWPEAIINSTAGLNRLLRRILFAPTLWMRARLLGACDGIIGLNHTYLAVALKEAGPRARPLVAVAYPSPLPEGTEAADAPIEKLPGEIWALSSGTLGSSHDHDTLLAAARTLLDTVPHLRIIVTGGGPYAGEFAARVQRENLHNVRYLGALPAGEFQVILKHSDIGIALYRRFSPVVLPTKVVDYLLAGLAVVTSAQGEITEMLHDASAGCTVPSEDRAETAAALARLAASPAALAAMRAASRRLARQFDHEKQITVIREMLVAVVGHDRPERFSRPR